jgi:hypothetical protein
MKHLLLLSLLALSSLSAADISITAANVVPSSAAKIVTKIAGATLTAGSVVYEDTSDSNKVKLADTDSATALARVVFGIAAGGAAAGQPVRIIREDPALNLGATVAIGDIIILSGTAGALCPSTDAATGDYVTFLAVATSTAVVNFKPVHSGAAK